MTLKCSMEYYRVFYHVAKLQSLTLAAKELSITQPAVSQTMKQLEEQLHTKLFLRASKGIKLTKEGKLLYAYVSRGYEEMLLGEQKLIKMQNMELGEVRIGASDMTLQFYLLPYLEKFHEKYPDIKVVVTNGPTPETMKSLEEGMIDFGVVSAPFSYNRENLEVKPVRQIEDTFVAGRKFISYKNKMLDLSRLEELPLICLEKNTSSRTYMEEFLKGNHVTLNPEFELATSEMIVQFAARNLGVGCVVKDFAKEEIEKGTLFELRFNKMIPKREFCLIMNKKNPLPVAAGKLLEIIL